MQPDNWERVDSWWADLLGLPTSLLWAKGVTVSFHAGLGDYAGIFVAGRAKAVHVSLPDWADVKLADKIRKVERDRLLDRRFWQDFGPTSSGFRVSPLLSHAYTDVQHTAPKKVEQVSFDDVAHWRDLVSRKKWEISGFGDHVTRVFAVRHGHDIAAAANLSRFLGKSSGVGVLTHPKYRGKGYSMPVTKAATAYAVRDEGVARYRYDVADPRTSAIATALDFEDYARQLTVLPSRLS